MKRRNERQKGFTLIELLVVLIIIAVLAAVLVPALTSYLDDAREKKAVSEAQVCVTAATEWAAVQRTALISQAYQNNEPFADAYKAEGNAANKWSTDYDALSTAAPTVTGTLALAEGDGQYFLRPEPATTSDTTDDTMKDTVKAAAGVDGKLEKLQLNADGKVLYLLYTSAEGIPVAYTAAGTAQTPDTTIPVAKLPEDKPPTPPTPSHSGDLVFCVRDEYTGKPVPGIKFHLEDLSGKTVFDSRTTDAKGMVYFALDVSGWDTNSSNCKYFTLRPESWPVGYQQVFNVKFSISAEKTGGSQTYNSYRINGIEEDINEKTAKYKKGSIGTLDDGATDHLYTFYARTVPTLHLRVLNEDTQTHVSGVNFTMSYDTKSETINSSLTDTEFYVQLHDEDNLPSGCKSIDLSSGKFFGDWSVKCNTVPEGYQKFEPFYLKILLENRGVHNNQLYTESRSQVGGITNTTCTNDYEHNRYIVTIPVQGGKEVNFFVYDGLDSVHTTQLPNVKLQLSKQGTGEIATFTTDEYGKPKGAENFTQTLSEGEYTLKLVNGKPTDYTQPADITFKVERVNGLLTLTGDAAYVDNDTSTVKMLVTKPDTMRFKLQIVDYNNGAKNNDPQWAGVNVRLTGDALDPSFNDQRAYAINSIADNEHTFDIKSAKNDKVTVTIVGDKDDEREGNNASYTDNFVKSKFEFKLNKNSDGTFTLTPTNNNSARDGYINGDTVYVYAYPKVYFDYKCYPTPSLDSVFGQGTLTVDSYPNGKSVYTVFNSKDTTHSTIQPWIMAGNRNHPEGVPLGSYELKNAETHPFTIFKPDSTSPWYFTVTRDESGFPVIKDKNETITKTITAKYTYLPTGS